MDNMNNQLAHDLSFDRLRTLLYSHHSLQLIAENISGKELPVALRKACEKRFKGGVGFFFCGREDFFACCGWKKTGPASPV